MAGISPDSMEPVLLFCDTFSHPENEVSSKTIKNLKRGSFLCVCHEILKLRPLGLRFTFQIYKLMHVN